MLLQRNNHAFEDIQRLFPAGDIQGIQHFQKFVAFYLISHHQTALQHVISGCRQGVEDQHKGLQGGHFIPAFDVGQIPGADPDLLRASFQAPASLRPISL